MGILVTLRLWGEGKGESFADVVMLLIESGANMSAANKQGF